MLPYVSPINPSVYPHLALVLMTMGFFFMAWFFVYPSPCAAILAMCLFVLAWFACLFVISSHFDVNVCACVFSWTTDIPWLEHRLLQM